MVRLVGLSATLPNYIDVADFLHVNSKGLFVFDGKYRPVPLTQKFVGVFASHQSKLSLLFNQECFKRMLGKFILLFLNQLEAKKIGQVMIFVHSRRDTQKTAEDMINKLREAEQLDRFEVEPTVISQWGGSGSRGLQNLLKYGFGIHHAGMPRSDRKCGEKLFDGC